MIIKAILFKHVTAALMAVLVMISAINVGSLMDAKLPEWVPRAEGIFFPTATELSFTNNINVASTLYVDVGFRKSDDCKIIGVNWYNGDKLILPGLPENHDLMELANGDYYNGQWQLDVPNIESTTAVLLSLCENERLKVSPFYPTE